MAKVTAEDFARAITSKRLTDTTPTVSQLNAQVLQSAWKRMPPGALPKEQIFTLAMAITLDMIAEGR